MNSHLHPFNEMIVILRGTHRLVMGASDRASAAGDVLLYPAGVAHEEWANAGATFESAFIAFECEGMGDGNPRWVMDTAGRVRDLVRWLYDERHSYYDSAAVLKNSFLAAILAEYGRLVSSKKHGMVETVRAFMRDNLSRPVALDELAASSGLSRYHFLRTYKSLTGRTPVAELRRMRLESARDLLMTTNLPLKNIAPLVGMESEYHISRLLRKHFGLGARQLRRRAPASG